MSHQAQKNILMLIVLITANNVLLFRRENSIRKTTNTALNCSREKLKQEGKSILVTGGAGFVGMHISLKLRQKGYEVFVIDNLSGYYSPELKNDRVKLLQKENVEFIKGDVCNMKLLEEIFKRYSIDRVIHLAAQAGVRYSVEDPHSSTRNNVDCFVSVLEAIVKAGLHIKPFIYASSSSVYGFINESVPSVEDKDDADHPASLYATTKRADELIAHSYNSLYKMPSIGMRFFTVYGEYGRYVCALNSKGQNIIISYFHISLPF